eukprot:TRINITY_DN6015_c0_g1_i2.p5 TRINITY_DN6015_c0_g1~~TRINITY_DN6015_c0_g1_i2.p5  ORF type:complete len:107 (+),score=8.81 TRINITY_DN6015_c0_g1_i2:829-1149(+)
MYCPVRPQACLLPGHDFLVTHMVCLTWLAGSSTHTSLVSQHVVDGVGSVPVGRDWPHGCRFLAHWSKSPQARVFLFPTVAKHRCSGPQHLLFVPQVLLVRSWLSPQ